MLKMRDACTIEGTRQCGSGLVYANWPIRNLHAVRDRRVTLP